VKSKEFGPRGLCFDFTPEGWILLLDVEWNDGMVEYWNIGYKNGNYLDFNLLFRKLI
jgi:hypothetical protein